MKFNFQRDSESGQWFYYDDPLNSLSDLLVTSWVIKCLKESFITSEVNGAYSILVPVKVQVNGFGGATMPAIVEIFYDESDDSILRADLIKGQRDRSILIQGLSSFQIFWEDRKHLELQTYMYPEEEEHVDN